MPEITKDSVIVELFSKNDVKNPEYKDAVDHIRELASRPTADNRYEIAQIIRYAVDNQLEERLGFLDMIADVKRTQYGVKAEFEFDINNLQAFIQAKGSTTERSKVGQKFASMKTDEVSIRPYVNFHEMAAGKVNVASLISNATTKLETKITQKVQTVLYSAFSGYSSPNFSSGAGIVKANFDPIVSAMSRVGKPAIVGDPMILAKLTALTGFNNIIPDSLALEHNNNGYIGTYLTGNVVALNNPFEVGSLSTTMLRSDLLYVIPAGASEKRPLKVHLEGELMAMEATNIDDKSYEIRLDKYFGCGIVGDVKFLGVYEDTTL